MYWKARVLVEVENTRRQRPGTVAMPAGHEIRCDWAWHACIEQSSEWRAASEGTLALSYDTVVLACPAERCPSPLAMVLLCLDLSLANVPSGLADVLASSFTRAPSTISGSMVFVWAARCRTPMSWFSLMKALVKAASAAASVSACIQQAGCMEQ